LSDRAEKAQDAADARARSIQNLLSQVLGA
jgi:hypothetical protein